METGDAEATWQQGAPTLDDGDGHTRVQLSSAVGVAGSDDVTDRLHAVVLWRHDDERWDQDEDLKDGYFCQIHVSLEWKKIKK